MGQQTEQERNTLLLLVSDLHLDLESRLIPLPFLTS